MSYEQDTNENFKKWTCKECLYINKRYLCCGKYIYGNRDETKCQFCGEDKSNSDDYKEKDLDIKWSSDNDEKEWIKIIKNNENKYIDSDLITSESYKLDEDFNNPSYDTNPPNKTFKAECVDTERFTEKEFQLILKKTKLIYQNKDTKNKFKANFSAGINVDIKKGDSLGIEHIFAILLYIHFPKYINEYRVSLPSKFYHFGRFIYEIVTYFGQKMDADMIVYAGLSGGLNIKQEEKKEEKKDNNEDEFEEDKRKNDEWEFFNTGFLTYPFSACKDQNIFKKNILILSLKAQFLNDFNDTKYFDLSYFSSFKNGNEILFFGEFSELSVINISVSGGDKSCDFNQYFKALNMWQKLTSGFADYNAQKYNIEKLNKTTQDILLKLLNNDKDVPIYIQQVFKYYNQSKKGVKYHRMYDELLDIDFSNICKSVGKELIKPIQELLFNDDITDVDPAKIKKIFTNGKKYIGADQKEKNFS